MDFTAIDFETATGSRNSACSVALVTIKDRKVIDSYYSLIRPPGLLFSAFNISIHGITPAMVRNEPDFAEIWPELEKRLTGNMVIAHNASFDMGVLHACLQYHNLPLIHFRYCCTVKLARKAWPSLPNHKLDTIGEFLHINFSHHNALADAKVCAAIPLALTKDEPEKDLTVLADRLCVPVPQFD